VENTELRHGQEHSRDESGAPPEHQTGQPVDGQHGTRSGQYGDQASLHDTNADGIEPGPEQRGVQRWMVVVRDEDGHHLVPRLGRRVNGKRLVYPGPLCVQPVQAQRKSDKRHEHGRHGCVPPRMCTSFHRQPLQSRRSAIAWRLNAPAHTRLPARHIGDSNRKRHK
jgi:hypothetical protein